MSNQILLTLISGIIISGLAGYLGTLMLSKRMSIVAGPLAHLSFPGVALAIIFGFSISYGVFPFVILGAIFIWFLKEKTKLPMQNLAAITFAIGVGTSLLFLPIDKAEEALVGSLAKITFSETILILVLSTFVFFIIRRLYQRMMLINVSEDLARTEGINVKMFNLYYLLSIAVTISMGVYLVGGLITAALVAIPSATAKNVSKDLRSYKIFASLFGIISAIVGISVAHIFCLPIGPLVIISNAVLFFISIIFMKKIV